MVPNLLLTKEKGIVRQNTSQTLLFMGSERTKTNPVDTAISQDTEIDNYQSHQPTVLNVCDTLESKKNEKSPYEQHLKQ